MCVCLDIRLDHVEVDAPNQLLFTVDCFDEKVGLFIGGDENLFGAVKLFLRIAQRVPNANRQH
jgi:hypothetical protein